MVTEDITYTMQREAARDLKRQLSELDQFEESEIILKETSPARKRYILYSMEDGSEVPVFRYRVDSYLAQTIPGTNLPRFTSDKSKAPQVKVSQYPCFLAPESEIRAELDSLGITVRCNSKHPSKFAMEQVAAKKHPNSWKAWQAHLAEKDRKKWEEQQALQVEAMLALAQNAAGPKKASG